jgi:predicted unusual protein kinase regulating ubiquinone biosynthesis (AarF/ABC1/UbiB family)
MNGITLESYVYMDSFKSIASGSIGQVYYGKRKEDNLEIAIKVKHPNIKEDLNNQYEIISFIKIIQSIKFLRNYFKLHFNLDDFLTDINLQCDFNNEANNCKKFQDNFKDSSNYIVFPKIIYQSDDLLISEYINGEAFENLSDMEKYQTSINFVCFFYQMLLVDNFLHGDLHCKNWKIRKIKDTNTNTNNIQIIVYDCGICFQNTNLELTKDFWFSLINYDIISLSKVMIRFINNDDVNNRFINYDQIEKNMNLLFNTVLTESISTTILIKTIINVFSSNNIIVHKFLLNISILLCVIEEFLKDNNIINKDKHRYLKRISMFEIIADSELDIIAFCDVKKCYPKIRELFSLDMDTKYKNYRSNIENNNIIEIKNNENKLFSTLALSTLKFRPPE